jgi:hypothetical protein
MNAHGVPHELSYLAAQWRKGVCVVAGNEAKEKAALENKTPAQQQAACKKAYKDKGKNCEKSRARFTRRLGPFMLQPEVWIFVSLFLL